MRHSDFPKRAIHLDFHTMPGVHDVGIDFNADEFASMLAQAGVDYVTAFARCNLGFCYYPSKVGLVHPGLQQELLGPMIEACHARGIRVAAYINAGLDHEHALRHRDWVKVNKQGQVYQYDQMGHWFRDMCLNSGYGDHLLALVDEVLNWYPIDGLFLDCFEMNACYGTECVDGMKALGLDVSDDQQAAGYCEQITRDFVERVKQRVAHARGDIALCFNGLPYRWQPTHLEIEALPTGGWGYDFIPVAVRYGRSLGKPFFTMTGRFHESWGDFGGLRTEPSLLYDCLTSVANGGTCSIGDHMHPRGRLDPEVYRLIGQVYHTVQELEPWLERTTPVVDIAVVAPSLCQMPQQQPEGDVRGACRMLSELHYQFDILDGTQELSGYRVIVLPDRVVLSDDLQRKLKQYLDGGGAILSSSRSGLNATGEEFALAEYDIAYHGPEPFTPTFFQAEPIVSQGLPAMLTTIYEPGIAISPGKTAEVLARLHQPYFNYKSWDWRHENLYIPPDKDSGRPAVVRCSNNIHFSFPVFSSYFEHSVVAHKILVRNCLRLLLPDPIVETEGIPSFGRVTLAQGDGLIVIHLLNYVPELRGARIQMIEEPICAHNVTVRLRVDGRTINRAFLAPSGQALEVHADGCYNKIVVPEVRGYQMIVCECV